MTNTHDDPRWVSVTPDWERLGTAAALEEEFKPFKFNGPGWYMSKTDTVLILPAGTEYTTHERAYRFMCWNVRSDGKLISGDPREVFKWINSARVVEDRR